MLYAKVTRSDAGYDGDKEKIKVLSLDTYYPVTNVSMGGSHTSIFIDGIPESFNSVHFTFYKVIGNEFVEHDIFSDPIHNPYL